MTPPVGVVNLTPPVGVVNLTPPVGVVDLTSPVGVVNQTPPAGVVDLASPVGVVDLASPVGVGLVSPVGVEILTNEGEPRVRGGSVISFVSRGDMYHTPAAFLQFAFSVCVLLRIEHDVKIFSCAKNCLRSEKFETSR